MKRVRLIVLRWECGCLDHRTQEVTRFFTEVDRSLLETGTVIADCPNCGAVLSSDTDLYEEAECGHRPSDSPGRACGYECPAYDPDKTPKGWE